MRNPVYIIFSLLVLWFVCTQQYGWIAIFSVVAAIAIPLVGNRYSFPAMKLPRLSSVVFLGFALRLLSIVVFGTEQFGDFFSYEFMAMEIKQGDYLLCLEKQTGPSLLYALFSYPFGSVMAGGMVLNMLLQTADIFLAYKVGETLASRKTGIRAAFFIAVFPDHIYYTHLLSSEVFFTTGLLLAMWLLVKSRWKRTFYLPLGLVIGAMNYFRPHAVLLLVSAMVVIALSDRDRVEKIWSATVIVSYFLINLPLILFNYKQMGILSVVPAQVSGMSMLFATTNENNGAFQIDQYNLFLSLSSNDEHLHPLPEANKKARQIALGRIRSSPVEWLTYSFTHRLPFQFGGSTMRWAWLKADGLVAKFHLVSAAFCSVVMLLFAYFLIAGNRPRNEMYFFMFILLIISILTHFLTEVNPRYNHHLILGMIVVLCTMPRRSLRILSWTIT